MSSAFCALKVIFRLGGFGVMRVVMPVVAFALVAGQCLHAMRQTVRDLQGVRLPVLGSLVAGALVAFVGCGRPATNSDCEEILDKSATIELKAQNVTDPAEVKKRTEAVRAARGKDILAHCVGRRVTDKAMACVRNATTAEQVDRCLE